MVEQKTFDNNRFALDMYDYRVSNKYSRNMMARIVGVGTGYHYAQIESQAVMRPNIEIVYNTCTLMGRDIKEYFV